MADENAVTLIISKSIMWALKLGTRSAGGHKLLLSNL